MIKLFVSDMDGTLLNENHVISKRNAEAIRQLEAAGIEFMIATGRTLMSATPLLEEHGLQSHMINLNGAAIYDTQGRLEYSIPMEPSTVAEIMSYCAVNGLGYTLMTDQHTFVIDVEQFIEDMRKFMPVREQEDGQEFSSQAQFAGIQEDIRPLDEFDFNHNHTILKMMVFSPQDPSKFDAFHQVFDKFDDIDITSSAVDNREITHTNAQKGIAVESYAQQKGYTMDQVATIGDSLNDRSMLKMAKYSYAMDNASPEVKAMAKFIAPSNREDGVALVIEQILSEQAQS